MTRGASSGAVYRPRPRTIPRTSGVAEPSAADRLLTERLKQALALVDIRVLDHFVVGEGVPTSFAVRGGL